MVKKSDSWFTVDKEGLKSLQLGKSKAYVIRELIQNAWDEKISTCKVQTEYNRGTALISVEDDSPEGFRDLRDSFTLFKHTYKRLDATKRGRFNIGEKQVIAICSKAIIETTKGTVVFDSKGRFTSNKKRETGSRITVYISMTKEEYNEILENTKLYLSPKNIIMLINGQKLEYKEPYKIIEATLLTEIEEKGILKKTLRKTQIHVHKVEGDNAYIYEMGIPVMKIECQFSIDIQQKIPLNVDRETVSPSFLKSVFAEVLNTTYEDVPSDSSSQLWIRQATSDKRIQPEALKSVIQKRFGDKVAVANPFDRNSIDEAISHGYKVVSGSELSKEEWANIKDNKLMQSTSDLFGTTFTSAETISEPSPNQMLVKAYAQKIALKLLKIHLRVTFVKSNATAIAQYNKETQTLTFNVSKLPNAFFENYIETTSKILHELGHQFGNHTEHSYHEALTNMAQELIMIALKEPEFFEVPAN